MTATTEIQGKRGWTRLGAAALALALAAGLAVSAQTPATPARELRLVSTAWPPFTNVEGQPRFALDLVDVALGRINAHATTAIVEASEFTTALLSPRFDGSAAAWKDAEREQALVFSQPYIENRLILVGRHGTDVSATTLDALKGKKVAVVGGYSYGDAIDSTGPTFVKTASDEDSLTHLLDNRADYALMDDIVVRYIIANYPTEAKTRLELGTTPVLIRPLYFALRRSLPDAESLIARFNGQIRGMLTDGTYNRMLHMDWVEADVDGDGVSELIATGEGTAPLTVASTYPVFTTPSVARPIVVGPNQRFLIGGSVYDGWGKVPDQFKVPDRNRPDPNRSTLGIFRFVW